MRLLLPALLLLGALAALLAAGARAEDEETPTPERLHARIQALEAEVQYLLARDEATTAYLLAHTERAKAFAAALGSGPARPAPAASTCARSARTGSCSRPPRRARRPGPARRP